MKAKELAKLMFDSFQASYVPDRENGERVMRPSPTMDAHYLRTATEMLRRVDVRPKTKAMSQP